MDQRDVLKKWMTLEKLGRREAAEKLGVKQRRLDTWLLPTSSNERRAIEPHVLEQVELLIKDTQKLAMLRDSGKIQRAVSPTSPVRADISKIEFPAIYRLTYPDYDLAEDGTTFIKKETYTTLYQFTPQPIFSIHEGHPAKCEQIGHLNPILDEGWLSVAHLKNTCEIDGFLLAHRFNFFGKISFCELAGKFFALTHHTDRPSNFGIITYSAQYNSTHPIFGEIVEIETVTILPSGKADDCFSLYQDGD